MKHPVVLGPCPCRGCGQSVYWDGMGWRNVWYSADHWCPSRTGERSNARSIGYTELVGMSDTFGQFDTVRATPAISSSLICGRRSFQEDES